MLKYYKVERYYFDHNATTPVSPEVMEAMVPCLVEVYGNASSIHHFGQIAKQPEFKYCAVRLAPAPDAPEPAPDFARTTRRDKPHEAVAIEASPRPAPGTASPSEPTGLPHRADRSLREVRRGP